MKNYIFLLLLFVTGNIYSQNTVQSVVGTAGDLDSIATVSVSWTVGELAIETLDDSIVILSQGFQQGKLTVSSLVEQDALDFNLKAYPNPVVDILILETDEGDHIFQVISIQGEIILNGLITSDKQEIDFTNLSPGVYILSVDQKQTHKIIKQ